MYPRVLIREEGCNDREPEQVDIIEGLIDMVAASRLSDARLELALRPLVCYADTVDSYRKRRDVRCGLFERRATHGTWDGTVYLLLGHPMSQALTMEYVITISGASLTGTKSLVTNGTIIIHIQYAYQYQYGTLWVHHTFYGVWIAHEDHVTRGIILHKVEYTYAY
jgi:hypothetical protein